MWIVLHDFREAIGPFETYGEALDYKLADRDNIHMSVVRLDKPALTQSNDHEQTRNPD